MNEPLVSILMTSYNREDYIEEAISSVLQSNYGNFELIIVDDGSKDNTVAIAKKFQEIDSRIRLYQNEMNHGDYPNRNKAASYARGKYLKYVDSDDRILPDGLRVMVESMESNPDAAIGVMAPTDFKFERSFPIELTPDETFSFSNRGAAILSRSPLSIIIRREVFEKENGFLPVRQWGDAEFLRRVGMKYNFVLIEPGLVWYRFHEAQENAVNSSNKRFNIVACNRFINLLKSGSCRLSENVKQDHIRIQRKKQWNTIKGTLRSFSLKESFNLLGLVITNQAR